MIDLSFYFKDKYRIPSTRLKNWDYSSAGWYFVTICTYERKCYFGKIINKKVVLSNGGRIADRFWLVIPKHFENVLLDEHIVMPNHVHGIIIIKNKPVETCHGMSLRKIHKNKFSEPVSKSLSMIVNHYKSAVKRFTNKNDFNFHWQSRFFDHIIRSEKSLQKIRQYIRDNPLKWDIDENNPKNLIKC